MVPEYVFVGVVACDQDAERVIEERIAEQSAKRRRNATVLLIIIRRTESSRLRTHVIERLRRLDVDGRADGARGKAEVRSLQHIELADVFGTESREVEVLAVAGGNGAALGQDLVELGAEAADCNAGRVAGSGRGACACAPVDGPAVN